MEAGHPYCRRYPLGMLMDEEKLVRQRKREERAAWISDLNLGVAAVINKEAVQELNKLLRKLNNGQA